MGTRCTRQFSMLIRFSQLNWHYSSLLCCLSSTFQQFYANASILFTNLQILRREKLLLPLARIIVTFCTCHGTYTVRLVSKLLKVSKIKNEFTYEVIVSFKIPIKNYRDFCPESLIEGRAEISVIFGWDYGTNEDLINSFWI